MPKKVTFFGGLDLDCDEAIADESNVLHRIALTERLVYFKKSLYDRKDVLLALVAQHLGLEQGSCEFVPPKQWMSGAFNVVIPVTTSVGTKVVLRCPFWFPLAEHLHPGTIDEKMRSEVATYAWLQENCPSVPIPFLYGFGFPDGSRFAHFKQLGLFGRFSLSLRRYVCRLMGWNTPSLYAPVQPIHDIPTGYMVIEYIDQSVGWMVGQALEPPTDPTKRDNLHRSIARIVLALAQFPQQRIGSWQFQNDGTISLTGRPITSEMAMLEGEGAPRTIMPGETFTSSDTYISELLTFFDSKFLQAPNAVVSEHDCRTQMATHLFLRTSAHRFLPKKRRAGPFIPQLTDLNPGNIFVDDDYNVTSIVDLEWMISRPVDFIRMPSWLTGRTLGAIAEHDKGYTDLSLHFINILEQEERLLGSHTAFEVAFGCTLASILREAFETKSIWFHHCLTSVDAMHFFAPYRLFPAFNFSKVRPIIYPASLLWAPDVNGLVLDKLAARNKYTAELATRFGESAPTTLPEELTPEANKEDETSKAMKVLRKHMVSADAKYEERMEELKRSLLKMHSGAEVEGAQSKTYNGVVTDVSTKAS